MDTTEIPPPATPAAEPTPTDSTGALARSRVTATAWWSRISLQSQLLAILMLLLVTSLAVLGFAVQRTMQIELVNQVDRQLVQALSDFRSSPVGATTSLPGDRDHNDRFVGSVVVLNQLQDGTITVVRASETEFNALLGVDLRPALAGATPAAVPTVETDDDDDDDDRGRRQPPTQSRPYTVEFNNGAHYRAIASPSRSRLYGDGTLVVMQNLATIDRPIAKVRGFILIFGLGLIALCGLIGWLAVRRAFTPLVQVEQTAEAIAAGDLSRRVPDYPPSTEVGRLTSSLNAMLARIESAFRAREASEARTKRFAADASHELRTPLASIRGYAELYRQGAVPTDEVPRAMRRIEDEAKRMGGLVEDLLTLARLDEQRPVRQDGVDLLVIASDAVHDAKPLDPQRPVRLVGLKGNSPEPAPTTGDEDRLRQVVANLVGNAVRHTAAGSPIEVAVGRHDDQSVIEVRDHGGGLTEEQAERIFERFYRADASRQRGKGGGSGLGLSIVQAVVAAHHGRVEVRTTPGGGATFVVTLPAAHVDSDQE